MDDCKECDLGESHFCPFKWQIEGREVLCTCCTEHTDDCRDAI